MCQSDRIQGRLRGGGGTLPSLLRSYRYRHTANRGSTHLADYSVTDTTYTRALLWPKGILTRQAERYALSCMSSSNTLGFSHVWLVLALSCCLQLLRSIRPGLVPSWRPGVSLVCSLAPCCQCLSLVHWLLLKQFYCLWHLPYYAVVDSELNQWRLPDGDSGAKPDRSPNAVDTYPVEIQGHSQYPIFFLLFGASADISLDYLGENKQKVLFWRSYIMKNTFSLLPRYINWSFLSLPILRMRIVLHGLCNPPTGKTALLQAVHVRLGTKERTQMQIGHTLPRPGACSM